MSVKHSFLLFFSIYYVYFLLTLTNSIKLLGFLDTYNFLWYFNVSISGNLLFFLY